MTSPAPLVVITDADFPMGPAERIFTEAGLRVRHAQSSAPSDLVDAARGAQALVTQWAHLTAEVFDDLPACRFVGRLGIGYDMIAVDAATERGIAVANTPDYCVEEVVAHTLALVLASIRHVPALDRAVRAHSWSVLETAPAAERPSLMKLAVIGYGRIGSRVAECLATIGFEILVHDPFMPPARIEAGGHRPVPMEEALAEADVLTLHLPLTEATHHFLDQAAIAQLKPGGYVVNTCRGALIDETALAAALVSGHLGAAALDVFETEPLAADSPLREAPNLLLTPHAAWYSPASMAELPVRTARQVVDFLEGRPVPSIVNPRYVDALAESTLS